MLKARLSSAFLALTLFILPAQAAVEVTEVTSPGGLTAWLVQDETIPVTAIEFSFKGGGAGHDPAGKEGVANLAAATMDEGAGDLDAQAFQRALSDQSISLSFSANRDSFAGSFYVLNRYRDEAVDLLRLALNDPRFDDEPVNRMRDRITIGLRQDATDPDRLAGRALFQTVFGDHAYARWVSGTEDSLATITREDLEIYRQTALSKDRLFIGVAGDISPEELGPMLDTIFGALPETGAANPTRAFEAAPPAGTLVIDVDVPQSSVRFAKQGLQIDDPRYFAGMVLNHVLGGGSFSSQLTREIRVKRGLAYSVYSYQNPMDKAGLLMGGAATQNSRVAETVDLVKQVFRDLQENGLTEEQLADAKTYITGAYPLRFTNTSSIAGQLAAMRYYDFPIDYFEVRNTFVERVTLEEVNALAADLLDPEALTIVVAGKPEGIESTLTLP